MVAKFAKLGLAALVMVAAWTATTPASAVWLYWGYVGLSDRPTCFARLEAAARAARLDNIRVDADTQVSGGRGDNHSYAVMTCAPGGEYELAIIMVATDDDAAGRVLRDELNAYVTPPATK